MTPSPVPASPQPAEESLPWPGLSAYTEQSRGVFFGRNEETALIVQHVAQHRLTVLHGPAGSGKSSLLAAGCLSAMRSAGLRPLLARLDSEPGGAPFENQIRSLLARLAAADGDSGIVAPDAANGAISALLSRWSACRTQDRAHRAPPHRCGHRARHHPCSDRLRQLSARS